jgi:hypothetical protein
VAARKPTVSRRDLMVDAIILFDVVDF